MLAIIGLVIGIIVGLFITPNVPVGLQPYLPIMIVAALDALFGESWPGSRERSVTVSSSCLSSPMWPWPPCWCGSVT